MANIKASGVPVIVRPTDKASNRTKNTVKRFDGSFELVDVGNPICFNGKECLLLKSGDWLGWIPSDEINESIDHVRFPLP